MTSSSCANLYNTQDLLVLPRDDLTRKPLNNKKGRSDLVLMKLPQLTGDRPSHIRANSKRATLMTESGKSYKLVTVGTSNTLVIWKPNNEKNNDEPESSSSPIATNEPEAKRLKTSTSTPSMSIQQCQLVVPGGSGATFLTCQPQPQLCDESILTLLPKSMDDLVDHLQYSSQEISQVLNRLPVILFNEKLQLASEEEIWQGQAAVVQTVCEEYDEEEEVIVWNDLIQRVEDRLALLLAGAEARRHAIATKFCQLACAPSAQQRIDAITIHKWVVQDLLREQPQEGWVVTDFLAKWKSRVPLSYEPRVSKETLVDMKFNGIQIEGDKIAMA